MLITVKSSDAPKSVFVGIENYTLETNKSGIFISAENLYGASRALATMAQLIVEKAGNEYVAGMYNAQSVKITDFPVYKYRSLMIDTARHFLSVATVKRQINGMAISKLNALHIHIIDSQSSAFVPSTKPADDFAKATYNNG